MIEKPAVIQHDGFNITCTLHIDDSGYLCNEDGSLATFQGWEGKKVNVVKHEDLVKLVIVSLQ